MRMKRKLEEEEEDPLEEEEGESMRDTQMPLVVFDLVREREDYWVLFIQAFRR